MRFNIFYPKVEVDEDQQYLHTVSEDFPEEYTVVPTTRGQICGIIRGGKKYGEFTAGKRFSGACWDSQEEVTSCVDNPYLDTGGRVVDQYGRPLWVNSFPLSNIINFFKK